ncbi:MAG TPA: di-heme oxidoredictase family protein [Terriglobales bacterium]|jgi:CxxC motif-containing protein (DUF1111 family)|nr:di-heme oxidoredictase family protein [Terriglobales bacterium]
MKAPFSLPGKIFGGLVVIAAHWLALTPNLTAQGIDPGPRPTGSNPAPLSVCQVVNGVTKKFNTSTCFDVDQPRTNTPPAEGAGQIIAGAGNLDIFWFQALTVFANTANVTPLTPPATSITGLGPSFNALSCFGCHAQPTIGGASPGLVNVNGNIEGTPQPGGGQFANVTQNPEFIAAFADGATNRLPCFIVPPGVASNACNIPLGDFPKENFSNGPVEEVRFPLGFNASVTADIDPVDPGAVANLYTFTGRSDENAPGCNIGQEPITQEIQAQNAIFRTPTPTYGLGFVENTSDLTLEQNSALNAVVKASLGITSGVFNRSGNDRTITRFGWKAQNKSLMMFAGEASNVEMGVTNELFPNERTTGSGALCTPNPQPEDEILLTTTSPGDASQISSVLQNNAVFMRMNAAASQCDFASGVTGGSANCNPLSTNALNGRCFFGTSAPVTAACQTVTGGLPNFGIGCVLCHSDTLTTANSNQPGLTNFTYHPYSDFALHSMGQDGDGVSQGQAGPTQFRTAPLWGAGQRFFFMHDGRYFDLDHAIRNHCPSPDTTTSNESCDVITSYENLTPGNQTLILEFLRSL